MTPVRFLCKDCGFNTLPSEYYMVHNALWRQVGMQPRGGMLCVGCLEDRLGRLLARPDFTDAPVNRDAPEHYSARLRQRLVGE